MLFAYRNTPHEATRKQPSYLLYGRDCHYPIEATFLPANEVEGADLTGYRQELTDANKRSYYSVSPESPEALQKVYDKVNKCSPMQFKIGDLVLIRFLQEESGKFWKLSRPWHGPLR